MTVSQFLTNVSIILTVMAIAAAIEIAVPMFAAKPQRQGLQRWGYSPTFQLMATLAGITAAAFALLSREKPFRAVGPPTFG